MLRSDGASPRTPTTLSRPVAWFLLAFGVWSWFIWITFVKNLWKDGSGLAFDDAGDPTAYFWVHLLLAVASFLLGTAIGVIGFRGVRALRRQQTQQVQGADRQTADDRTGAAG
ncbi:SCO4848 family membrane protein [Streptomyces lydicus]|uniref:SCO4848 family membrane protein n=1 Tax=Streptomyces lydicus TaxID=47763 RepID=UPI0036F53214